MMTTISTYLSARRRGCIFKPPFFKIVCFPTRKMAENGDQTTLDYTEFDNTETDGLDDEDAGGDHEEEQDSTVLDDSAQGDDTAEDPELEAIKARVREMEEEAEKLKEMQNEVEKQMNLSSPGIASPVSMEDKVEQDARSVYVGQVDYGATAEELEAHFHGCGSINRVTILCDKFTGHPKGFAYIEFADKDSVTTSLALDESLFRGRQIKVGPKRTNRPGLSSTNRPPRGRGFRGRGFRGGGSYYGGYTPRGRGRGFRGRGRSSYYSPY